MAWADPLVSFERVPSRRRFGGAGSVESRLLEVAMKHRMVLLGAGHYFEVTSVAFFHSATPKMTAKRPIATAALSRVTEMAA